jgi:hypothetical protein
MSETPIILKIEKTAGIRAGGGEKTALISISGMTV